jgi:hypothetical protein
MFQVKFYSYMRDKENASGVPLGENTPLKGLPNIVQDQQSGQTERKSWYARLSAEEKRNT